jgi:tetratricopeptide (TPR) repeat protein
MKKHPPRQSAIFILSTSFALLGLWGCVHSNSAPHSDPDQALVFKSGDKEAVMGAGVDQSEWESRSNLSQLVGRPKAEAELASGKAEKSEQTARLILLKNPANTQAREALATSLYLQGNHEKAAYYARLILEKDPGNAIALNISGLAMMKRSSDQEDIREAKALFEKAFSAQGSEIAAGLNLAHLLLETGNSKRALATFEQTANRCGNCFQALLGASIAARRAKDFKTSKEFLGQVLDGKSPIAYYHLALWYVQSSNDLANAREALGKVRDLAPNPSSLIRQKADSFFKLIVADMEAKGGANENL